VDILRLMGDGSCACLRIENVVTRFQSTMSGFCRSSSTRGWIRSCGECSGILTTIQLTAAVVQTWRRPQQTPTGGSMLLCLFMKAINTNISITEQLRVVIHICDTFYILSDATSLVTLMNAE